MASPGYSVYSSPLKHKFTPLSHILGSEVPSTIRDSKMPLFEYNHQIIKREKFTSVQKLNRGSEYWWILCLTETNNTEKITFYCNTLSRYWSASGIPQTWVLTDGKRFCGFLLQRWWPCTDTSIVSHLFPLGAREEASAWKEVIVCGHGIVLTHGFMAGQTTNTDLSSTLQSVVPNSDQHPGRTGPHFDLT